jgi:aerobic-type carbon monoxide dehydrogenase small subunit (CoxS/CutS family)
VRSCITQVARAAGKQITTIEGLERNGNLHPLQVAFIKADAMQCAYCTSGMIMAAAGLLRKTAKPSRAEIIEGMNGNICRCGTYQRIIEAIQIASGQTTKEAA